MFGVTGTANQQWTHVNVGYLYRSGDNETDALLATIGFDHALADWVAVAADLISELQVGENALTLPEPVTVTVPFRRVITPTNIPNRRDDIINGAFGVQVPHIQRSDTGDEHAVAVEPRRAATQRCVDVRDRVRLLRRKIGG